MPPCTRRHPHRSRPVIHGATDEGEAITRGGTDKATGAQRRDPARPPARTAGPDGTKGAAQGGEGEAEEPLQAESVPGDEPLLPARVHRPADLIRLLLGVLGIIAVLGIAAVANATTEGLGQDISKGARSAPSVLVSIGGFVSSVAVLVVPVAFAIDRLIKRDGLRIADGVLAAVLAHGVSLGISLWVTGHAPEAVQVALTQQVPGGGIGERTDPVHGYLAPVIAYMTASGLSRRSGWQVLMWAVLILDGVTVLIGGYSTPVAMLLTVLIGWTVAYGTLYAVGSPNVRPTGRHLLAGLRRLGFRPVTAHLPEEPRTEADSEHENRGRRYLVTLEDSAEALSVTVIDREQQAQGFFYRAWRRLSLRGIYQRRSIQPLRQLLEEEALPAYAAQASGCTTPELLAASELGPDAVMFVYEYVPGRTLDALADDEITDGLLRQTWDQVRTLQARRIAHGRLDGDAVLLNPAEPQGPDGPQVPQGPQGPQGPQAPQGTIYLTDLRSGEIAAGDVMLRMDIAQLLVTLALRVGAERAVTSAVRTLGPDAVADSLPLLQPIALTRGTRGTLRRLGRAQKEREREAVLEASKAAKGMDRKSMKAEKKQLEDALENAREDDLLTQIRHQVLLVRPQAPVEPARLERISPRTLISVIAGVFAAYFLFIQFTHVDLDKIVEQANWGWVALALLFSAATYPAAAMSLLGFVPERVSFLRTVLAQVAGSFVKLVAPAAVGGVALNARFLQRAGVRPGLAVASVGASQLFGLGCHILLLLVTGYLTGTERTPSLSASRAVIAGLLAAAVLVLVFTAVPILRRFVSTRVRSLFAGVVPRMLDLVQRPKKLLAGIGGMLLLTAFFVLCLDASIRAFGGELTLPAIAVVFLAGNALGSAAPTPGGVGAVELALTAGLTAAGLKPDTALSAVLLFRLLTFWLPVLPGWASFTYLSRKGAL
ncbi:flippase-like domain-containing protein [Streptomyces polyrhachis]|uniref:Flippase-like domain-containing protein n=1 Tax=Streptomyces polyrhachis TaxID=1282885 RepID=A0ABW2GI83_9ACTN